MRKILLIIFLFSFIGCSKEMPNPIVGTWALVDYTAINVRTGEKMSASTDVKTWTFKDGGSAYINGSTPLTYTINDRYLTISYVSSGKEIVYEIEELTTTTLKVYWYFVPGKYQYGMDEWYTFTKMKE